MDYNRQNYKMHGENDKSRLQLPAFNPNWINKGIDAECVKFCEALAKKLSDVDDEGNSGRNKVSSSFLRNIFGEIRRIQAKGFEVSKPDFYMLRPKVAYAAARAKTRKDSGDPTPFREIYNKMADQVKTASDFNNMVSMIEAIVAYHKVYNPK